MEPALPANAHSVDADAFYFGSRPEEPMFGWLHTPRGPGARMGVVICNPFGFEEVAAHRPIRTLAEQCASAGLPCLRFDYLGCGNSALNAFASDLFTRWIRSVDEAVNAMRSFGAVDQVALVGFRLGAALATLAAANRTDVAGLVAISPVVNGNRYLRELRLLSRTPKGASRDGLVEIEPDGFPLSPETCGAIATVDLTSQPAGPERILLLEEPSRERESRKWSDSARDAGANVERVLIPGYELMSENPQFSRTPDQLFALVIERLSGWANPGTSPASQHKVTTGPYPREHGCRSRSVSRDCRRHLSIAAAPGGRSAKAGAGRRNAFLIEERIVSISAGEVSLFGILSEAPNCPPRGNVVLLNAGAVHSIGPNRLWVELAQTWASLRFRVLRLDLAGLGDSPCEASGLEGDSYSESGVANIQAALEFLEELGPAPGGNHLVGLCSGAYHALRCGFADLPLRSVTLVNPLAFMPVDLPENSAWGVAGYEAIELAAEYRSKVWTRQFWTRFARRQLDGRAIRKVLFRRAVLFLQVSRERLLRRLHLAPENDLVGNMERAMRSGMNFFFVFAADDPGHKLLGRHVGRQYSRLLAKEEFSVEFIPGADHTFTSIGSRRDLVARLAGAPFLRAEFSNRVSPNDDQRPAIEAEFPREGSH